MSLTLSDCSIVLWSCDGDKCIGCIGSELGAFFFLKSVGVSMGMLQHEESDFIKWGEILLLDSLSTNDMVENYIGSLSESFPIPLSCHLLNRILNVAFKVPGQLQRWRILQLVFFGICVILLRGFCHKVWSIVHVLLVSSSLLFSRNSLLSLLWRSHFKGMCTYFQGKVKEPNKIIRLWVG